ncbi:envelope glycoprotein G [Spheniscid alphaherpesvirus 1]|uniref:Envelope glycoprotein G n=1 Tax=Spheniscid alphaherpesvirus 1 TaxID=2560777 RepID=A0A1R3TEC4_9ALPH|nr:envelope glycoprotein G [Spheniscid alphaherpesvirus 1]
MNTKAVVFVAYIFACIGITFSGPVPPELQSDQPKREGPKPFGEPINSPNPDESSRRNQTHNSTAETIEACTMSLLDTGITFEISGSGTNVSVGWFYILNDSCSIPLLYREYANCTSFPPSPFTCSGYSNTRHHMDTLLEHTMVNMSLLFKPGTEDSGQYRVIVRSGNTSHTSTVNLTVIRSPDPGCFSNYGINPRSEDTIPTQETVTTPAVSTTRGPYLDEQGNSIIIKNGSAHITSNGTSWICKRISVSANVKVTRAPDPWLSVPDVDLGYNNDGSQSYDSVLNTQVTVTDGPNHMTTPPAPACYIPDPWSMPPISPDFSSASGEQSLLVTHVISVFGLTPVRQNLSDIITSWLTNGNCTKDPNEEVSPSSNIVTQPSPMVAKQIAEKAGKQEKCGCPKEMILAAVIAYILCALGFISMGVYICVLRSQATSYRLALKYRPIIQATSENDGIDVALNRLI